MGRSPNPIPSESMSTITPTEGNVVVEVKTQKEKSAGGIFIPDAAKSIEFIVLAVPEGTTKITEGSRVLIKQDNSIIVEIDGRRILVVPVKDVFAVVS